MLLVDSQVPDKQLTRLRAWPAPDMMTASKLQDLGKYDSEAAGIEIRVIVLSW